MTSSSNFQVALADRVDFNVGIGSYSFNDDWYFDQKLDGVRLAIIIEDGMVRGINRKGNATPVDRKIVEVLLGAGGTWVLDGEWVDETFWMFDLPISPHHGVQTPFHLRRAALEAIAPSISDAARNVRLLPTHKTPTDKLAIARAVVENRAEGLVLKNAHAGYTCGKRSKGMLKAKLIETIDCVISIVGREGKRSIAVEVYDDAGRPVDVGSATVTEALLGTLEVGNVVEVAYLYATSDRRLYQPQFVRVRDDKPASECTLDQLKYTDRTVLRLP